MKKRDKTQYCISIKKIVIDHYGGVCECCGENNLHILNIDHVEGGGRQHRAKTTKRGGYSFYLWLRRNNYPAGFRVMCANCNMCIGHHGFCPHKCDGGDVCQFCQESLTDNNVLDFYREYSISICMKCVFKFSSSKENIDQSWVRYKTSALMDKQLVVKNYGGTCQICGEDNPLFLTIDHIFGGGEVERKNGKMGVVFYRHLKKEGFPTDKYQLLCYNCNCNKKIIEKLSLLEAA